MKNLIYSLVLMLPFLMGAKAQADDAASIASKLYSTCQQLKGQITFSPSASVEADGKVCVTRHCTINSSGSNGDTCDIAPDAKTVPAGCAKAILKECGYVVSAGGAQGGDSSGNNGGNNGGNSGGGDDDGFYCVEAQGKFISKGMPCWRECKKHWLTRKEGFERKKCVRCLLGHPGLYTVDVAYLPKDSDGNIKGTGTININGVSVRGEIICYDKNGKIVKRVSAGISCPSGSSQGNVSTSTSGNGSVVINTGDVDGDAEVSVDASVLANGNLPAWCIRRNGKIKRKCLKFIGGGSVSVNSRCQYDRSLAGCVGDAEYNRILAQHYTGADCVNCNANGGGQHWLSGLAEVVGAIAPPLAYFGSNALWSKQWGNAQNAWAASNTASNQAWSSACLGQYQAYLDYQQGFQTYTQENELPGLTAEQAMNVQQPGDAQCSGANYSAYAGMNMNMGNGFGGFGNGFLGAGYSPGFMSGMIGPYGNGGFNGGFNAGFTNGFGQAGYVAAGFNSGYSQGGFNAGWNTGFGQAGYVAAGFNSGYSQGGFNAGWNSGYGQAGYVAAGFNSGFGQAGNNGCYSWGCNNNSWNGGWGSGTTPWGYQNGGYWNGSGGWGNPQADLAMNMQYSNMDAQFQNQGLANQFGMANQNMQYGGNFGSQAGFSPFNMGGQFNAGWNLGWGR